MLLQKEIIIELSEYGTASHAISWHVSHDSIMEDDNEGEKKLGVSYMMDMAFLIMFWDYCVGRPPWNLEKLIAKIVMGK